MRAHRSILFPALALAVVAAVSVSGKSLEDQSCLRFPPKPIQPNIEWAGKVGSWYLTAGNQLHLYRTAADLANVTVASLTPGDLYYRSCLRFDWGLQTIVSGFGGKTADVGLTPNMDGTSTFRYANLGMDATATNVLTDDATFVMFYVCWAQGRDASYAIISTGPTLSAGAKKAILAKVKELGFLKKQFALLRHESCQASSAEAAEEAYARRGNFNYKFQ